MLSASRRSRWDSLVGWLVNVVFFYGKPLLLDGLASENWAIDISIPPLIMWFLSSRQWATSSPEGKKVVGLLRDNLVSPARIDEIVPSFSKHQRLALLPSSVTKTLVSLNCKLLSLIWSRCSFTNNSSWHLFRAPETRASNTSCIAGRLT